MKTKTSIDSPIFIVEVVPPNDKGGWIAITIAPGKKTRGTFVQWDRDLDTDLDRLKELGVTTLTPFIEDDEMKRLKIPNLVEATKARGIDVVRFPFHDVGIPDDMDATITFIDDVITRFTTGERILMHCNGGLGRAGTIAVCVRLALGLDTDPDQAITMIRKLRSHRAIETKEQERFVGRFQIAWQRKQS
jgi:ADP-ribosyl-[dinitrogen reductase] hydrolase